MSATDMEIEVIIQANVNDSALLNLRGIARRPLKEICREAYMDQKHRNIPSSVGVVENGDKRHMNKRV